MDPKGLQVWRNPVHFLAFGFGSGLAPVAPGTFGTVVGVLLYLLVMHLDLITYLTIVVVTVVVGIEICGRTSRDMGVHDHSGIVWDEIAGMLITMIAVPIGWLWLLGGFLLFRFFDILKPWPISWIDRNVKGGVGIMLDDVLAGVFALACLHAIQFFIVG